MRPIIVTKAPAASSANNVCLSQTPGAAGALTLNGAAVVAGVAILDTQRVLLFTPAGADHARTFTIQGTDQSGLPIGEVVQCVDNPSTVSSTLNYKTVTSIVVDAAFAGALTVGTSGVAATPPIPLDQHLTPLNATLAVEVSGTINYTVQYTMDDIFDINNANGTNAMTWTNHPNLTSKTAYADANVAYPASAVRLLINSYTAPGSAKLFVRQAGIFG